MMASELTTNEAIKLGRIEEYERHVANIETLAEIAKRRSKWTKDMAATAIDQMRLLINTDTSPTLPGMEDVDFPEVPPIPTWRDMPLSILLDDNYVISKLEEYNYTTVGSLVVYLQADKSLLNLSMSEDEEQEILRAVQLYWDSEHREA